jgi:hypothetical protein
MTRSLTPAFADIVNRADALHMTIPELYQHETAELQKSFSGFELAIRRNELRKSYDRKYVGDKD